jgi:hypothetical protein
LLRGFGVDCIFNPALHPSPDRARSQLLLLAQQLSAGGVFANNHQKGGSFIYNGLKESISPSGKTLCNSDLELDKLRSRRPSGPKAMTAPRKV